jgi:TrmH family RNA methyltransferase
MAEPGHRVLGHRNKLVVDAASLHRARERRITGLTLVEGPHLLAEALAAGSVPVRLFALAGDRDTARLAGRHSIDLHLVDDSALLRLAGTKTPRGPVAVIQVPPPPMPKGPGMLVAWGVSDPGNVGTMIRTASAFGWDFGYTAGTADPWSPKVLRSAAGGHFRLTVAHVGSLADLEGWGLTTAASVVRGGLDPTTLEPGRYALLVGVEASGLPGQVVRSAPVRVTVPMPGGTESLNAAVAAAILVYEISKHQVPGTGYGDRERPS